MAASRRPQNSALIMPDRLAAGRDYGINVPALFLVFAFLIGTLYVFVMPPLQIPDEMRHLARAYSVSTGACIASPDIDMPESFVALDQLFQPWLQNYQKISMDDLELALQIPLNDQEMAGKARERSLEGFINQNGYHCAPYIPEAIVLNLGRHAGVPVLALMYLCRMTNLAFYVLATYLALRLLPDFRMLLFCLALMPMSIHQGASASADATTIAAGFLFTAYVFRIAFGEESGKLGARHYLILAALIAFLVLSKSLLCMALLLLLIPGNRFPSQTTRWLAIGGLFLLAIGCEAIWQYVNAPNMARKLEESLPQGIDVAANIRFMHEHPLTLVLIFARCLMEPPFLSACLHGFVGNLGWLSVQLPDWLLWTYFALLVIAATQASVIRLTVVARGVLLVFLAAAVVSTLSVGWIGSMPKPVLDNPVIRDHVLIPFQGRYWIPFAFPMFVLFSTSRLRINPRYFSLIAAGVVLLANAVALRMVVGTYYR